jgi:hypothetical protein
VSPAANRSVQAEFPVAATAGPSDASPVAPSARGERRSAALVTCEPSERRG